jgi:hypothetical protein
MAISDTTEQNYDGVESAELEAEKEFHPLDLTPGVNRIKPQTRYDGSRSRLQQVQFTDAGRLTDR